VGRGGRSDLLEPQATRVVRSIECRS
jgi:hypothetical protein